MTNAVLDVMPMGRDRPEVDEFFEADKISGEMAAVGGLVVRNFTSELGPTQAMMVARRVFSAMRNVEARQPSKDRGRSE
jgi:hypothetical protein